ncbi:MerR family DNA-binding transcriptional regulator [Gammaproteobacteria bacterium LSUCC0057]|jgi:DNA-binding transcriptional MerR regulator|uniref:MerR family DNA-binding transcriptional regulator n=1 Tax=Gammaproteobacteria bacterium LSUCC0057 TaxID=2559237 RepID=A0A4Y8UKF5_9GAMM|nr:MerR family DNA-binding transcriptional regulator [Gammaproteobacteria bacterium LSUCC0057]
MVEKYRQYSISQLAKEFDITPRAIRHYEQIGLITPTRVGQNRIYNSADRTRLKLIVRGKRLGLSLEQSREIINMYEPGANNHAQLEKLIDAIRLQRKRLEQQLEELNSMLGDLDQAEAESLAALAAPEVKVRHSA